MSQPDWKELEAESAKERDTTRRALSAALPYLGFILTLVCVSYDQWLEATLFAIASAFFWRFKPQRRDVNPFDELAIKDSIRKGLWCAMGKHYIGNEPYTFYPEKSFLEDQAVCLRCLDNFRGTVDERTRQSEEQKRKEIEWNNLTEVQREARRAAADGKSCPKCDKLLDKDENGRMVCPMCDEFANDPNAPMHRVKRILKWASLSDAEREKRESEFIGLRNSKIAEFERKVPESRKIAEENHIAKESHN